MFVLCLALNKCTGNQQHLRPQPQQDNPCILVYCCCRNTKALPACLATTLCTLLKTPVSENSSHTAQPLGSPVVNHSQPHNSDMESITRMHCLRRTTATCSLINSSKEAAGDHLLPRSQENTKTWSGWSPRHARSKEITSR